MYHFEYLKRAKAAAPGAVQVESAGYSVVLYPSDEEIMMGKKRRDKAMIERFRAMNGGEMPLFNLTIADEA